MTNAVELGEVGPTLTTAEGAASAPMPPSSSQTIRNTSTAASTKKNSSSAIKIGLISLVVVGAIIVAIVLLTGGSDDNKNSEAEESRANSQLNSAMVFPTGTTQVQEDAFTVDESLNVTSEMGGGVVNIGSNMTMTFKVGADTGFVGIRFGATGPINVVPVSAATGEASFTAAVPNVACDDISSICHSILCYEFAISTDGTRISRANINQVAMVCGACDEPSCQALLNRDICTCEDDEFTCAVGTNCVPNEYFCDGTYDCADGSDEQDCPDDPNPDPSPTCTIDCLLIYNAGYAACQTDPDPRCFANICNDLVRCYNKCGLETLDLCTST